MNRHKFHESLLSWAVLFILLAAGLAYLFAGCSKPKAIPAEKGFTLERFDATNLKSDGCNYGHNDYSGQDKFTYSCWYTAKDGTQWNVSKTWYRSKP